MLGFKQSLLMQIVGFSMNQHSKTVFIFFIPHVFMAYKHRCYQEFILDTFSALTKRLSAATRLLELQISH